MLNSDNTKPLKQDVEHVLAEFELKKDILAEFCLKTRGLIEAILQDARIRYQSVQFRVKEQG